MNFNRPLILASSSPRRQYLMREAGFKFRVQVPDIDESFPPEMLITEVPKYLAEKKAKVFESQLNDEIVISSDTIVILNNEILNKPLHRQEAVEMLSRLSGHTHTVITAVCLLSKEKIDCFDDHTKVTFKILTPEEISFYVDNYKPYDKAGAYGAQDCLPAGVNPCSNSEIQFLKQIGKLELIEKTFTATQAGTGMVAIEKINGSYFTVMGMPMHLVYTHLKMF
ncbi:MAG: Maf family protein [Cyclobacteriaceae bacterium]